MTVAEPLPIAQNVAAKKTKTGGALIPLPIESQKLSPMAISACKRHEKHRSTFANTTMTTILRIEDSAALNKSTHGDDD